MLEVAKEYLIDKKFHENGIGRKLPFLLAAFTVGEGTQKGEEKFINRFLREAKAGSGVSIKGMKLPFTTLSVGGGDCEHGGIYYTLWHALQQKLYYPILGKNELGMMPVPYVVVTALKELEDGTYTECDYNENGIIVANSYTNLSGYKDNKEATEKLIINDDLGRKWVTCNTYGYIDKVGAVHVKGRVPDKQPNFCHNFDIDDTVIKDTKNILSCVTVDIDNYKVMNIQFQPLTKINKDKVLQSIYERLENNFPSELLDNLYVRIIPTRESFPLTASGKRSVRVLEELSLNDCMKLSSIKPSNIDKKLVLKK